MNPEHLPITPRSWAAMSRSSHCTIQSTRSSMTATSFTTAPSRISTYEDSGTKADKQFKSPKSDQTCKYAQKARVSGCDEGLGQVNLAMCGERWILKCRSVKCSFQVLANYTNGKMRMSNDLVSRHGIQYRWAFLTKSHVGYDGSCSDWPYSCLLCLHTDSASNIHYGVEALMSHIAGHSRQTISRQGRILEGRLLFNETDIKFNEDSNEFDLVLPNLLPPRSKLIPPSDPRHLWNTRPETVERELPVPQNGQIRSEYALSVISEADLEDEIYENPWRS